MITLADPTPDLATLTDFALGKLSSRESLKILQEIERNPKASKDLEFILTLMSCVQDMVAANGQNGGEGSRYR